MPLVIDTVVKGAIGFKDPMEAFAPGSASSPRPDTDTYASGAFDSDKFEVVLVLSIKCLS